MSSIDENPWKHLFAVLIEDVLIGIGKPVFEKVSGRLQNNYHCSISDCYDHPEYLAETLKRLYGSSYSEIVKAIQVRFQEYKGHQSIAKLLEIISAKP